MAQTTEAHDADLVARLASELAQGRVRGDAGAHQWGGARRVQPRGDSQHVALVNDHARGIASVRPRLLVLLEAVKRECDTLLAEHLVARAAFRAPSARIDDAAHADEVALAEVGCAGTLGCDSADDLVAGHDRELGVPPVVVHLVHVAVANAAVENLDLDIVRSQIPSLDGHGLNRRLGPAGAVCRSLLGHGQSRTRDRVSLLCNPPDVNPHGSFPRREHPSKTSCIANGSTTQHGGRLGHRRSFSGPSTAVKELIYTIAIVILPMKPKLSAGQER